MKKILVADNSLAMAMLVKKRLESEMAVRVATARSLAEIQLLLQKAETPFFAAVLNLKLQDAPNGEAVEYVSDKGITSIVLTGSVDRELRNNLFSKNVIDYYVKEGKQELDQIIHSLKRLIKNGEAKALVVDDARFSRTYVARLLERQHFNVLTAEDGPEALGILEREKNISLLITDFNMPSMTGCELISLVRRQFGMERLAIIGTSGSDDSFLTAQFIKAGANDFLRKPFGVEEFYCRIFQNMDLLRMVAEVREASNTDYLTRLFNRRYFYDVAPRIYGRTLKKGEPCAVAMLDIDFFKKINDNFGHDGGDVALKTIASILKTSFRASDIVSRFGGEEFCVLMPEAGLRDASNKLEAIRVQVANTIIPFEGQKIKLTMSFGLACDKDLDLDDQIKRADERLYLAKTNGRNRVVWSDNPSL